MRFALRIALGTICLLVSSTTRLHAAPEPTPADPEVKQANSGPTPETSKEDDASNAGCLCCFSDVCACPLFPIMTMTNGTVYYCDYFNPNCDVEPEARYLVGDYSWPWETCPDDCAPASYASFEEEGDESFHGLDYSVDLNYMHRHDASVPAFSSPAHAEGELRLPAGPTRHLCRVNQKLNDLFLKATVTNPADGTEMEIYAKVLQFEVNKEKACFKPDQNNWKVRYVAFELDAAATKELKDNIDEHDVIDALGEMKLTERVYSAQFRRTMGQRVAVLLLLQDGAKKPKR